MILSLINSVNDPTKSNFIFRAHHETGCPSKVISTYEGFTCIRRQEFGTTLCDEDGGFVTRCMNVENKMESSTTAPPSDEGDDNQEGYQEGYQDGAVYDVYESSGYYDDDDFYNAQLNATSYCDNQGLLERPTEWMTCFRSIFQQNQINISPSYAISIAAHTFCGGYADDNAAWVTCVSQVTETSVGEIAAALGMENFDDYYYSWDDASLYQEVILNRKVTVMLMTS